MSEDWTALAPADWEYTAAFDGRGRGCGEVLLDLKIFVRTLSAGTRVLVHAGDPGAKREYPAWCRLTGHTLVERDHPLYLIQTRAA